MGLFGKKDDTPKKNEGGLMDAIRCDQTDYLIWKWRPEGQDVGTTKKENAIRYGSSLNVKDGEVAAFVYHQKDGTMQDFIEGPYNDTIKTANFPVLSKIVGLAFGGSTPFQAEVYYINMAGLIQLQFGIPFFDTFDPRPEASELPVPMAVRGSFAFSITDYKEFVKLHRLSNFELEDFKKQIKDNLIKRIKGTVINIPDGSYGGAPIPLVQIERKIEMVSDIVQQKVAPELLNTFGVTLKTFNISDLEIDKESEGYKKIKSMTADYAAASTLQQQQINLANQRDMNALQMDAMKQTQASNMENMRETMRINREEGQFAQHAATEANAYAAKLGAEQANIGAFAIKNQTQVGVAAAEAMGKQGASGAGNVNLGGGSSMNPGAMMANMAMGQAVGMGMANMLGNSFAGASTGMGAGIMPGMAAPTNPIGGMQTPPPAGNMYNVAVNGASSGPFSVAQLQQMTQQGQLNAQSLVWTNGMANWQAAGTVAELSALFAASVPPVPPPVQ
jgi:membrane protease subunit (stomatin/prohibitin family)